jgi:hypothetical protein
MSHGVRYGPTKFVKQVSCGWTVWIPHRGRRGEAGRANSKKDLLTGPIRGFCALQALKAGNLALYQSVMNAA